MSIKFRNSGLQSPKYTIKIYVNYNNKRTALVNADKNIFSDLWYLNDGYDEYIFVFLKNSKLLLAIETDWCLSDD